MVAHLLLRPHSLAFHESGGGDDLEYRCGRAFGLQGPMGNDLAVGIARQGQHLAGAGVDGHERGLQRVIGLELRLCCGLHRGDDGKLDTVAPFHFHDCGAGVLAERVGHQLEAGVQELPGFPKVPGREGQVLLGALLP